jgi:hypothetical protein
MAIRWLRSLSASRAAHRLLRQGWSDLARLAAARRPMIRAQWVGIMLDRFGLVIPRLAASGTDIAVEGRRSLAALQIGLDLLALKQCTIRGDAQTGGDVSKLLPLLSRAFRWHARGIAELKPDDAQALLTAIDSALCAEIGKHKIPTRRQLALVGLRRTLFPHARAFSSEEAIR